MCSGARGVASLLRDRFALQVDRGEIETPTGGAITVDGSSFVIPDVTIKGATPAEADIRAKGPLGAALALLDHAPLSVLTKAGLPADLARGRADLDIQLAFPLRPKVTPQDIRFDVAGVLRDVSSAVLVEDRELAADRLDVLADNDSVEIAGQGTFDRLPLTAQWRQEIGPEASGPSELVADVELSARAVETLKLGLPDGAIGGQGRGRLALTFAKDTAPRYALTSDLAGVQISIPPLGWSKPSGSRGRLEVVGQSGETPRIDRLELEASGLSARGVVALNPNGGLREARFDRVRAGGWLDAPVTLQGRGAGAAPGISVRGGTLDMRQASFDGGPARGEAGPLSLDLDRLRITDTIAVHGLRGQFDLSGGLRGRFSGTVNGGAAITGLVQPNRGRSAFQITSSDAGAVFSNAGLLKQARGGEMRLTLTPVGTAGAFNGALQVANTRIQDAPAIAELFNALSVVGLLEQMGGQGLHFADVQAAFRLTPDRVTLTQASAVGPSIGLSMDGTYDVNTARMDMQGVFSPIYLINGVGSALTRRGEGLIGFNFRLFGDAAKPQVQVNPLSALTPAFFRELFRRPPPEVAREPGESPGSAPQVPDRPRQTTPREHVSGSDR